jgi:hypothetical protein
MDFPEDLQKAVIDDFNCVFLVTGVPVTYCHSITVERAIHLFLALSFVQGAFPDMKG